MLNIAQFKMYDGFQDSCHAMAGFISIFLDKVSKLLDSTENFRITKAANYPGSYLQKVMRWLRSFEYPIEDNIINSTHRLQEHLCMGIKKLLVQHVKTLHRNLSRCEPHLFLRAYTKYWQQYSTILVHLNTLLDKFDHLFVQSFPRYLPPNSPEELDVYMKEEALNTWGKVVIIPLTSELQKHLNFFIQTGRISSDPDLVLKVFGSILQVSEQIYQDILEEVALKERRAFYGDHAIEVRHQFGNSKYIEELTNKLDDDKVQICKIIGEASFKRMHQQYHVEVLSDHLPFLHESCLEAVTKEQWKNLYDLLQPFQQGIEFLLPNFEKYIKDMIFAKLNDGCPSPVQVIGDFHSECSKIVHQIFKDDIQFIKAMDWVCSQVLAISLNLEMRRDIEEKDVAEKAKQYVNLLKYIKDWESFCNFSNLLLSRRLLRGTTCSINAERTMVEMLTEILGISHTYKLSTMLTDMSISDNITADFKMDLNHNTYASCEKLSFQVLNSFAWPHVKTNMSFNIPKELGVPLDMFQSFYKQKFPERKLTWHHKRSSCEIQLLYLRRPYLILVESSYMASLLLLFDNQDSFSIQELVDKTHLPLNEIMKNLQALVDVKLLVVESSTALHHRSIVSLNMSFTNKRRKILVQYKL